MKKALYWQKLKNNTVQCSLCPHFCVIEEGKRGKCGVRENQKGILYSLVYGKPNSAAIDPVEKKPLNHFFPGTMTFSIGTAGCNLKCHFCQNYELSQSKPEDIPFYDMPPEKVVEEAIKAKCHSISYTYSEPTIFYEYVLDTAKLAKKKGLKNIFVTNGFINPKPLEELCKYIDAAHVDLKGFDEEIYSKTCGARLKPVLETLKLLRKKSVWFEVINLVIPNTNDDMKKIKEMCLWLKKNIGEDCVLHFSRFFPCYLMSDTPATPIETLEKAKETAEKAGLHYIYVGNVSEEENTYCPKCRKLLIRRSRHHILENNIEKGKCSFCKTAIAGRF
ncbi:MAG: AmmeMemoRadiSam system radical SAM enzyme [Candidatus Nanoarchaeia archaeon]|nr:AmmeMemoRadiSam system radical SAM enzyme [Candidatus Nanoarchaeia archaeon]